MDMAKTAIMLDNLCFGYNGGSSPLMKHLTLKIPGRCVCAILGPNGSGKTTLMKLLLGILTPNSGEVFMHGIASEQLSRGKRNCLIGLVPQEETIPFALSVLEYVLLGRAPHLRIFSQPDRYDTELAMNALEQVGLLELKDRPMPSLSGGERQLAMVARVLTQECSIMLMDEPSSHLDLGNTKRILGLMRMLKQVEKTVIFTTHDPNTAAAVADHVVLMKHGSIIVDGDIEKVLTTENLSTTYGVEVNVMRIQNKPRVIIN